MRMDFDRPVAPREIARHLVVSAQPSRATPPEHESILHQNPSRLSHPKELLKHHFVPYGARAKPSTNDHAIVDVDGQAKDNNLGTAIRGTPHKGKEAKSRKRKVERDTPQK